jgi:RNA polymerase sigma factor (sigma-70 family)
MAMVETQPGDSGKWSSGISEEEMIRRILDGEIDLYSILVARYNRRIYNFIRRKVKNDMDAEDIVQEAHLRALTYLHGFRQGCTFATWLSRVATNVAYRQLQQRHRLEGLFNSILSLSDEQSSIFAASIPHPESCVHQREVRAILREALAKLPRRYRLIFLMKEVRDVETSEIARRLGIRKSNVRLQLHRARRMLRRTIDHDCQ